MNGDGGVGGTMRKSAAYLLLLESLYLTLTLPQRDREREKMTENERKVGESREAM